MREDEAFLKHLGIDQKKESKKKKKAPQPFEKVVESYLSGLENLNKETRTPGTQSRSSKKKTAPVKPPQLDLHQLTLEQAIRKTNAFIGRCQKQKHSSAIVVTGKGLHSEGAPVLKSGLHDWLSLDERISGISQAPYNMGGEGAWLIFLVIV